MKKAIIAVILLIALCAVLVSCKGVNIGINFYVDGELYEGIRTKGEEEISMPKDPVKDGYVFQGWYWDEGTWTQPFTASSLLNQPVSEALSVYAYFISAEELASTRLISFETMGAGAVNPVRIKVGEFISEPQGLSRPGYYLVGWYREADFTTKWNFATDRVSSDMTLYAKWAETYYIGPINYDESIRAITSLRKVTAEDFGATCFDNGGNQVEITVSMSTQTAGETATVRLTATSNGKTRTATIQNVRIYGEPTLTFDEGVTYFNLKDGLTADWFTASGTDTFGEATEIRFEIEGDYAAGDTVTVIIKSVDPAGNVTSGSVENVMVYGLPVITYNEEKGEISVNDVLSAELLTATAVDSFGEEVAVAVTLTNGTIAAGNTVTLTLTATDKYGNTTVINKDFAVYGMPTISNAETLEFRVEDEITPESLGITARDTYGAALEISLAVKEGAQSAGVTMIWTATVTDIAGNVTTKDYSVRIYGTPVITYDRDAVKVTEDATITASIVTFDLNGADGTAPASQTVTDTVGLEYPEIPTRSGYLFAGWYDNAGCSGTRYDFTSQIENDITLYAKWVFYSGNGVLPLNGSITVSVVSKGSSTKHYYAFVPLVSGSITIYSGGGLSDTYGYLYDGDKSQLAYDDDSGDGNNFKITYNVTAGSLYYIRPCGYDSSGTTTVYMTGAALPSDGGVFAYSGAEKYLNAYAYDSFGNKLTLTASVSGGELAGGSYITYTLTAVDHLGNVGTITTAAIPVYDNVADINLNYDASASDSIKLTSKGEEFTASATDTFGEACDITIERAGGGAIVAGEVQDIVIVATDRAGNRYVSETVSGIKVYGMPTAALTYPDNGYTVSENDDISFLFIVRDSFGEEIYAEVTSDASLVAGNAVNITVTATDDAGNVFEGTYLFGVLPLEDPFVTLMVSDALWQSLFVTDNVLPLPTADGMVFYGWFDGNGTRFTDEAGNLLVTPDEYVVLYARFYPEGYTPISTADELKNISLYGKYALVCDIDLGGAEWTPIGTSDDPFIGEFDGQGYAISNFKITTGRAYVGLFGYNKGVIKNLGVENFTVNVSYSGNVYAGGLVGYNSGSILNSYATGDVSATVTASYSYAYAGGLVGYNNSGTITNCYAAGNVSATVSSRSYAYAGGLVGHNMGDITNSYATEDVSATATNSSVHFPNWVYAGGLVGNNGGRITNSYAMGDVRGSAVAKYIYVGGLVGYNLGDIMKSYATGSVSASSYSSNEYAGGLVGYNSGDITISYATGSVSATASYSSYAYAGGLVGENYDGSITNCYATGNVSATAHYSAYSGGLVGYNYTCNITNCYATGEVSANSPSSTFSSVYAGGLVGINYYGCLTNCYATGKASAYCSEGDSSVGGLVGENDSGSITNCYATGNVSATADEYAYAGGLVGYNDSGSIMNCYATGDVSATSYYYDAYAGGLVGYNDGGSITNCYRYSGQTIKYTTSSNTKGTAKDLATLQSVSFHTSTLGWDESVWNFVEGAFPTLKNAGTAIAR